MTDKPDDYRAIIKKEKKEKTGRLNLCSCGLRDWPAELFELTWLTHLVMVTEYEWDESRKEYEYSYNEKHKFKNSISFISTEFRKLKDLQYLYCGSLGIKEIENLESLSKLFYLDLSLNQISEIKGLEKLTALSSLNLNGNRISEIKGLEKLTALSTLDLSVNRISEIKGLEKLTALSSLNLNGNRISEIKGLEKLTALSTLDLSVNRISEIKGLEKLTALSTVFLHSNQISEIRGLEKLTALSALFLHSNQISEIKGLEKLTALSILYLSFNNINEIKGLEKLTTLSALDLSRNLISEIKGLEKLTALSYLYLSSNQISEIKGLEKLTVLSRLDLPQNQISEIKGLEKLTVLSRLDLSQNKISEIKELENLTALSDLNLSKNQISKIKGLEKLSALSRLDLSENQISEIKGLETQTVLTNLNLSFNQISEIKGLIEKMLLNLVYIDLRENRLEKYTITDWMNPKVILGYIQSQGKENLVENKHIKLNVIGTGRIGKTQSMNFLCKGTYIKDAEQTHGMNQETYPLNNGLEASVWDFGGQEYHHGTHALFLRKKDFYIALWRNEDDKNADYAYWLGTARAFAPAGKEFTPPLMLVQNCWKINNESDEIAYPDSRKMKQYNLGLNDIFVINVEEAFNKNDTWTRRWENFKTDLNDKITDHAKSFGTIPQKFAETRQKLLANPVKEINLLLTAFKNKYAKDYDDAEFAYLVDYLEFAGCVLFFNEIEALRKFIFPNPIYLSGWIYKEVLDIEILKEKEGKLTLISLKEKLNDNEKVTTFLSLANHFQLMFEDPFAKDTFVVPQYLPEYKHSFKDVLLELLPYTFCLRFPDFMHEGRFFRFMAEYGKYSRDSTSYWKYGLLFKHKESGLQTLVYYMTDKRQVLVHIEDKKGRSDVARELFDYFAFTSPLVKQYLQANIEPDIVNEAGRKDEGIKSVKAEKAERKKFSLQPGVQISADNVHFLDVVHTQNNIVSQVYAGECVETQRRIKLDFMTINLLSDNTDRKLRIFFSYSHKDEQYRNEMDVHLTMLKRMGRIETWHDRKISPGAEWDKKIAEQINQADIVLLMISADFLHSDYIWEHELSIIRSRLEKKDGITVIPIFTRPCDTTDFDLMRFQGAQHDKQSQVQWISVSPDRDNVYTEIVKSIRATIGSLK